MTDLWWSIAMLYAARNLPKDHTLLLVHGVHSWMGKSISERDKPDILELEDHYESLCKRAGRDCKFKHFSYTSTSGFGDEVDCGQEGRCVGGDRSPGECVGHEEVRDDETRVCVCGTDQSSRPTERSWARRASRS